MKDEREVLIHYTNYKQETAWRSIIPGLIRFGATEHHTEPQWLLEAHDVAKNSQRTFAMRDIHEWKTPEN